MIFVIVKLNQTTANSSFSVVLHSVALREVLVSTEDLLIIVKPADIVYVELTTGTKCEWKWHLTT